MPFTASHVAAIIPIARSPLVPSALAAGAVAPDLLYYVIMRPGGGHVTHTWWGVLVVDLPLGVFAYVIFHALMSEPLLALAPAPIRRRVAHIADAASARPNKPAVHALAVAASVVIGAATHVVWDGFSHPGGWAVQLIPALHNEVLPDIPAYKIVQWSSTIVGGLIVLGWSLRWLSRANEHLIPARYEPPRQPLKVLGTIALVGLGVAAANAVAGAIQLATTPPHELPPDIATEVGLPAFKLQAILIRIAIGGITGGIIAVAGYGLIRRIRRHKAEIAELT